MYIDTEFYYDPNPLYGITYDAPTVLELERQAGIDMVVFMPQAYQRPLNAEMYAALQAFPEKDKFILCCTLNPQFGGETVSELERCVTQMGMRAMKLMPLLHGYNILSGLPRPLLDRARELNIVVNVHSGSSGCLPLQIASVARQYPELTFIMDHMGYRDYVVDAIHAARECPNILLSTTLVSPAEPLTIRWVSDEVGPERIVFGSNGPAYVDMCVDAIRRLKLGQRAEDMIFGGNAARAYGLD